RPRPAGQRGTAGAAGAGAARAAEEAARGGRGARQGTDVRRRHGRPGLRRPRSRTRRRCAGGDPPTRSARRQGRTARPHPAHGAAAHPHPGGGRGGGGHPRRGRHLGQRRGRLNRPGAAPPHPGRAPHTLSSTKKVPLSVKHVSHWIGGKPWQGPSERRGDIYNPATGRVSGTVDLAGPDEVAAAVAAAKEAFPAWRDTSLSRRTEIMFAFRELVRAHRDELARIISAEHGKVVSDALGEVSRGLEVVEFACGIPHLLKGGYSENVSTRVDAYSILQPLGV